MPADHYRTLQVDAGATAADLRTAYLRLARANHPDRFDGAKRATAQARMQQVNEAWNVVGVAHKRKEYDASRADLSPEPGVSATPKRGNAHFIPLTEDDFIDRSDIDLDPTPTGGGAQVPRSIRLMPIVALVGAILAFGFGLLIDAPAVLGFGALLVLLAGVGFVMVPLIVMSRAERDPNL